MVIHLNKLRPDLFTIKLSILQSKLWQSSHKLMLFTLGFDILPQGVIRRCGLTVACNKASMIPEQQDECCWP